MEGMASIQAPFLFLSSICRGINPANETQFLYFVRLRYQLQKSLFYNIVGQAHCLVFY